MIKDFEDLCVAGTDKEIAVLILKGGYEILRVL